MVLHISHVWGSMGDVWERFVLFGWTIYACNHDNSIVWKVAPLCLMLALGIIEGNDNCTFYIVVISVMELKYYLFKIFV